MSFLNSVLKAFVGDKRKKDLKQLQPLVEKVRSFDKEMSSLSLQGLRDKTSGFKDLIAASRKPFEDQIETLEKEIETAGIDRKEAIYKEIDQLNDQAYEASEKVLNEIQPEAFAVMRETAKRFSNNETIKVKATSFDRELSVHDYVTLEGDDAVWSNSWNAAGKPITWDMVHYDVQLIGGSVLHQGNIAEMMTGIPGVVDDIVAEHQVEGSIGEGQALTSRAHRHRVSLPERTLRSACARLGNVT